MRRQQRRQRLLTPALYRNCCAAVAAGGGAPVPAGSVHAARRFAHSPARRGVLARADSGKPEAGRPRTADAGEAAWTGNTDHHRSTSELLPWWIAGRFPGGPDATSDLDKTLVDTLCADGRRRSRWLRSKPQNSFGSSLVHSSPACRDHAQTGSRPPYRAAPHRLHGLKLLLKPNTDIGAGGSSAHGGWHGRRRHYKRQAVGLVLAPHGHRRHLPGG